jgi:proteasome beta subunit
MHDRTDKVLDLDRYSVLAIAGVPATAFEMARVLDHSFKYYRRSQLQDLSLEGKLRALSKLLRDNIPMAVQGIGAVAPIFAGYDVLSRTAKIFFYDILGAEFEGVEYAASGSGSPTIRGILHYVHRWGPQRLAAMGDDDAIVLALRLLNSAAEFDSATGGVNIADGLYPVVKLITAEGSAVVASERLGRLYADHVEGRGV